VSRRHLPLLAAAFALTLAVVLALLARDVRRWEESLGEGDHRFQVSPGPDGLWEPREQTLGGAARGLLAVDDDLRLRLAAQLFRRSRPRATLQRRPRQLALATSSQVAFSEIQGGDYPRPWRSIAANQIGILALADVLSDPTEASARARKAVQKFTEAAKLDPANDEAQANLELVLTLVRAQDPRVDPEGVTSRSGGTASGAGSSAGGRGF
jgi:hypothetical protein